jgi:hypothetical protein
MFESNDTHNVLNQPNLKANFDKWEDHMGN